VCSVEGHGGGVVVRAGWYGKAPHRRQRWLCRPAKAEGKDIRRLEVKRWTAQPPGSASVEVATKAEAVSLADTMPGTWKHRRRGAYRVVPLNAQRPKVVLPATAKALEAEGWIVRRRTHQSLDARCPGRSADAKLISRHHRRHL
jgi:hypothetical protein